MSRSKIVIFAVVNDWIWLTFQTKLLSEDFDRCLEANVLSFKVLVSRELDLLSLGKFFLALRHFHAQCVNFVLQLRLESLVLVHLLFQASFKVLHFFLLIFKISAQDLALLDLFL